MFIGLYTLRVLLSVIGVDDFGVYNVVGGISLFYFLMLYLFRVHKHKLNTYEHY